MLYGKHYVVLPSSITTHFLLTAKFCSLSASSCLSRLFRRHYEGHLPHSGMIDRPFFPGSSFILDWELQGSRLVFSVILDSFSKPIGLCLLTKVR